MHRAKSHRPGQAQRGPNSAGRGRAGRAQLVAPPARDQGHNHPPDEGVSPIGLVADISPSLAGMAGRMHERVGRRPAVKHLVKADPHHGQRGGQRADAEDQRRLSTGAQPAAKRKQALPHRQREPHRQPPPRPLRWPQVERRPQPEINGHPQQGDREQGQRLHGLRAQNPQALQFLFNGLAPGRRYVHARRAHRPAGQPHQFHRRLEHARVVKARPQPLQGG